MKHHSGEHRKLRAYSSAKFKNFPRAPKAPSHRQCSTGSAHATRLLPRRLHEEAAEHNEAAHGREERREGRYGAPVVP